VFTLGFASLKYPSVHIKRQLHRFARSRWALSTVVTTLIVIVISVLLASVVTYFAINVTSTRVQEESLALAKQHVWYDYVSGKSQAAIMIINAGGRDIVIDKITVRGQGCAWSKVFYNVTGNSISSDLVYNATLVDGGYISVGGSQYVFKQATNDITLQSGKTVVIYISTPDSISVNDVGLTVSINIFTSQAMYYKETNVQGTGGAVTPSSGVGELEILEAVAAYQQDDGEGNEMGAVIFEARNVGSNSVVITKDDLIVRNVQVSSLAFAAQDESEGGAALVESYTILSSHTALLMFYVDNTCIRSSDVNQTITIGLNLGGGHSVTTQVKVIELEG
jgi:hypothetical protein